MRVKLAALSLAIASLMLLPSSTKADTFEYDYTDGTVNIVFSLTAATLPTSGDVTSFTGTTDPFGTITEFAWDSAASGSCVGSVSFGRACAGFKNTPPGGIGLISGSDNFAAGSFLSPSIYTGTFGSTLAITDIGGTVPEPSSLLLLACGLFGLLATASFRSRIRRFASDKVTAGWRVARPF